MGQIIRGPYARTLRTRSLKPQLFLILFFSKKSPYTIVDDLSLTGHSLWTHFGHPRVPPSSEGSPKISPQDVEYGPTCDL